MGLVGVRIRAHTGTPLFLFPVALFVIEHALFGAPRTFSFLPPDFFDPLLFGGNAAANLRFDLIEQYPPREKTIESLRTLLLALHSDAGGTMMQQHA